jgi:hypothetical protein
MRRIKAALGIILQWPTQVTLAFILPLLIFPPTKAHSESTNPFDCLGNSRSLTGEGIVPVRLRTLKINAVLLSATTVGSRSNARRKGTKPAKPRSHRGSPPTTLQEGREAVWKTPSPLAVFELLANQECSAGGHRHLTMAAMAARCPGAGAAEAAACNTSKAASRQPREHRSLERWCRKELCALRDPANNRRSVLHTSSWLSRR